MTYRAYILALAALVEECCRRATEHPVVYDLCGAYHEPTRAVNAFSSTVHGLTEHLQTHRALGTDAEASEIANRLFAIAGAVANVIVVDAVVAAAWFALAVSPQSSTDEITIYARNVLDAVNRVFIRTGTDVASTKEFLEWVRIAPHPPV